MAIPLAKASKLAELFRDRMEPLVAQVAISGSVRLGLPEVEDISMLVVPSLGVPFIEKSEPVMFHGNIGTAIKIYTIGGIDFAPINGGLNYILLEHCKTGIKVRLHIVKAEYFGIILMMSTGSVAFNSRIFGRAEHLGLKFVPDEGIYCGETLIASKTEEDIFRALKMKFVPPEKRREK